MTEPTSPNDHALQRTRPNWVSPARAAFCIVPKHFDPKEQLLGRSSFLCHGLEEVWH